MSVIPDQVITQGTEGIQFTLPLLEDGIPITNLDLATEIIFILQRKGISYEIPCLVSSATLGTVYFILTSEHTAIAGDFYGQFKVVWADKTIFVPDPGYILFHIQELIREEKYCTPYDVYRRSGVDETVASLGDVEEYISAADSRIEKIFQKSFKANQTETEWIDIEDLDEDDEINTIFLQNVPVKSITSLESYNIGSATADIIWTASDYWLDQKIGRIRLQSKHFVQQNHRIKAVYVHGPDSVPGAIRDLSAVIASMMVLVKQIGGTYDDVTSYSMPSGVSVSVGEPYMNMLKDIGELQKERDTIIKQIGKLKFDTLVI